MEFEYTHKPLFKVSFNHFTLIKEPKGEIDPNAPTWCFFDTKHPSVYFAETLPKLVKEVVLNWRKDHTIVGY